MPPSPGHLTKRIGDGCVLDHVKTGLLIQAGRQRTPFWHVMRTPRPYAPAKLSRCLISKPLKSLSPVHTAEKSDAGCDYNRCANWYFDSHLFRIRRHAWDASHATCMARAHLSFCEATMTTPLAQKHNFLRNFFSDGAPIRPCSIYRHMYFDVGRGTSLQSLNIYATSAILLLAAVWQQNQKHLARVAASRSRRAVGERADLRFLSNLLILGWHRL